MCTIEQEDTLGEIDTIDSSRGYNIRDTRGYKSCGENRS